MNALSQSSFMFALGLAGVSMLAGTATGGLVWVGTDGNRIWGDNALDNGTDFDESFIAVREYPTVPEPSGLALVVLAVLTVGQWRRSRASSGALRASAS